MSDHEDIDRNDATPTRKPAHPGYAWVKSGLTGEHKDRVAIHEYDPAHPLNNEGRPEIWVAGGDSPAQKVAKTPEVVRHIREGELVEVSEASVKKDEAERDARMKDRRKAAFEAQHPEISRALKARGVRLGDLMTGDASVDEMADASVTKGAASDVEPATAGGKK